MYVCFVGIGLILANKTNNSEEDAEFDSQSHPSPDPKLHTDFTPSPLGTGSTLHTPTSCNGELYTKVDTVLSGDIPKGSKQNHIVYLLNNGHERLHYTYHQPTSTTARDNTNSDNDDGSDSKKHQEQDITIEQKRGNVEILIKNVIIDPYLKQRHIAYEILPDHLSLSIWLTASQALNGFVMDVPYINHKTLHIDRSNKVTFPNSNSTLVGLGIPILNMTDPMSGNEGESEDANSPSGSRGEGEENSSSAHSGNGQDKHAKTKGEMHADNSGIEITESVDDGTGDDKVLIQESQHEDKNDHKSSANPNRQDLIIKFLLLREIDDPLNDVHTAEEKSLYHSIMAKCGNKTSTTDDVVIKATNENIVITSDIIVPAAKSPGDPSLAKSMALAATRSNTGSDGGTTMNDEFGEAQQDPVNICSDEDLKQYQLYEEESRYRQLLLVLQKKREEAENL